MSESTDPILLPVGAGVDAWMMVHELELRAYGHGKDCTVLTLGTAAGRIGTAPLWGGRQSLAAGIVRGSIVRAVGRIGLYRGARQLELSAIRLAPPGVVDLGSFLPTAGNPARHWAVLDRARAHLRRPRLRQVLGLFYDDAVFRARYEECPASPAGHHAELGGLLRHTVEVAAARVRRGGAADDAGSGGAPPCRRRQRQGRQHGGSAVRVGAFQRGCSGERGTHLAAGPPPRLSGVERLGPGRVAAKTGVAAKKRTAA